MNELSKVFEHEDFGNIEVLMIGDKPYFPAGKCAEILGYSRARDAVARHCRYAVKHGVPHPQSPGKILEMSFIPEGDLYRLIVRSNLPLADHFERWVFDEVIPSIRAHGAYATDDTIEKILQNPDFGIRLLMTLKSEKEKNAALQRRADELTPKARYYDLILQTKNAIQVNLIAKDYGMSAMAFNKLLYSMKIQYKSGDTWVLYQKYAGQGYTSSRTYHASEYLSVIHTYWTQKGRLFLYNALKQAGFVPLIESAGPNAYVST